MSNANEIIDVNLTEQAGTSSAVGVTTETAAAGTVSDDVPTGEELYDVNAAYRAASGIVHIDVNELAKSAKTPEHKTTLFNKLLWHIGRITSCGDESHLHHAGRFNADGFASKLATSLKSLFGIN